MSGDPSDRPIRKAVFSATSDDWAYSSENSRSSGFSVPGTIARSAVR